MFDISININIYIYIYIYLHIYIYIYIYIYILHVIHNNCSIHKTHVAVCIHINCYLTYKLSSQLQVSLFGMH